MKKVVLLAALTILICISATVVFAVNISPPFAVANSSHNHLSISAAFDGTNFLVGVQGDSVHRARIDAQFVSQTGTRVGSLITTGRTGGVPFVGFDGTNYMLVWPDDTTNDDLYGCVITKSGVLGAPFVICSAAHGQYPEGIAFDGTNYLVLWDDHRGDPDNEYIARFVSPAGDLVGPEIPIGATPSGEMEAALAFDGTRYLVVYVERNGSPTESYDVVGKFVSKAGVCSSPFVINQTPSPRHNPLAIAFGGSNYLVTWNKDIGPGYPSPSNWDIYGRAVSPSGAFVTPEFAVKSASGSQVVPRVAWNGSRFLVAWTGNVTFDGSSFDGQICGRLFDSSGVAAETEFPILAGSGPRLALPIAAGNSKFLLGINQGNVFTGPPTDVYGVLISTNAPENYSISPTGSPLGTAATTLSTVFRDADGAANLRYCRLLINTDQLSSNAAFVQYDRAQNKLYLKDDANTSWGIGYAPGTDVVLQNSQCSVYVKNTTVSSSGTDLTVNWRISLKTAFAAKSLNAYMFVQDNDGQSDGWDLMGRFYNVAPQVVSIAPKGVQVPVGTTTTFTTLYRDLNGCSDLRKCLLLVNDAMVSTNAMYLWYDNAAHKIYLKNDANTAWSTGCAPGTNITLSNSQCEIYVKNTTVTRSGSDLTITWSFKLKSPMGAKNLYSWMYVNDSKVVYDGWKKMGTHFAPLAPTCVGITHSCTEEGDGTSDVEYADPNGFSDIYRCFYQISETSSQVNAVLLMYDAKQNKIYLRNDANTSWGTGYTPGTDAILENGQCIGNVKDFSVTSNGPNNLVFHWAGRFTPKMYGRYFTDRACVQDFEGLTSGWKVMGPLPVPLKATIAFSGVDSGTGSGTMDVERLRTEIRSYEFSAAPPDFASIGSQIFIPYPMGVGRVWTTSGSSNGQTITSRGKVISITDTVTVPAGTYSGCLRIEETNTFDNLSQYILDGGYAVTKRIRWFAPGVGPVKYQTTIAKTGGATEVVTGQLKSKTIVGSPSPSDWWPLTTGNTWVFRESDMSNDTTWTVTHTYAD